jgi:hypothetical protein
MTYNVTVIDFPAEQGVLTTDHPSSSYNQPVLVINGTAYGQGDKINGHLPYVYCTDELSGQAADAKNSAVNSWNFRVSLHR